MSRNSEQKAMKEVVSLVAFCDESSTKSGEGPRKVANGLAKSMTAAQLRWCAEEWLVTSVSERRRARTLAEERKAERERTAQLAERDAARAGYEAQGSPRRDSAAYRKWVDDTPEGREFHGRREAEEDESNQRVQRTVRKLIDDYTDQVKLEWTEELLASRFSLPDGTSVEWGDATLDQHVTRYEMFSRNMVTNMEGAARHKQAIDALRETGAATLREATVAA